MTKEITKDKTGTEQSTGTGTEHLLILINDDIHSFDYVVDTLIEVCNHTAQQAAQCTMITHYKGQCDIKKGSYQTLRPLRKALIEKELKARIN